MPVKVTLKKYLSQRNLNTYKLVQATTGRIAEHTVYALARPGVKRVDLETLGIIETLHNLTGETVTPNDLLEVIKKPMSDLAVPDRSALEVRALFGDQGELQALISGADYPSDVQLTIH